MDRGWVKIYRKEVDWEWYKEPLTAHLFNHLVLMANRKDGKWRGITVPRGCLITTFRGLAGQTGLTLQQVRTSIKRLISTHDITQESTKEYTLLKVENYDIYQCDDTGSNTQATHDQHTANTQATLNKNVRSREVKNSTKTIVEFGPAVEVISYWNEQYGKTFRSDTKQTVSQVRKLLESGYTVDDIKMVIDFKAREVQRDPKSKKWFTPTTVFRPENFQRAYEWACQERAKPQRPDRYETYSC